MSEQLEIKKDLEVLWTPQQVATYLGLNKSTVYKWIEEGRVLNPVTIVRFANRVRIPRSEVVRIAGSIRVRLQDGVETKL